MLSFTELPIRIARFFKTHAPSSRFCGLLVVVVVEEEDILGPNQVRYLVYSFRG